MQTETTREQRLTEAMRAAQIRRLRTRRKRRSRLETDSGHHRAETAAKRSSR
jgi:hypothetical protein